MTEQRRPPVRARAIAWAIALPVALIFIYPYLWMLAGAFRSADDVLTNPLRLWPAAWDFSGLDAIATIGGVDLWVYVVNSLAITAASTALSIGATALGAYALVRRPDLPGFSALRIGFLATAMYPYMLLVIPVYIVMFRLGLLGSYTGMILFLALGPVQYFLFDQFFRSIPREIIEAARTDGASELQTLVMVVIPLARPIVTTVALITFILNWAQWFPVLVISRTPDTYTLPVALLSLNTELGASFQGIMALAVITTLPVAVLFLLTQKRVMEGMAGGGVKG